MSAAQSASEVSSYYTSALAALRFLEHERPTGRRFGADADARWSSFRGDLKTADRIDLLIRDADAQWPGAFGARTVFHKRAVAEDEPFGPDWEPLDGVDAESVWRDALAADPPTDALDVLRAAAKAWGIALAPYEAPPIAANDKLVVTGPSAIAAVMQAFSGRADLDWAAQVTVIASPPGARQLASLAGALLGVTNPTVVLAATTEAKPTAGRRLIAAEDATLQDTERATELTSV